MTYFYSKLSKIDVDRVNDQRQKDKAMSANKEEPWYPLSHWLLAKMIFQSTIDYEINLEQEKVQKGVQLTYKEKDTDPKSVVRRRWENKMTKWLGIINPKLGENWFNMITSIDLEGGGIEIGLEKLDFLRTARIPNDMRLQCLIKLSGGQAVRNTFGIPSGDKAFRLWVSKETWLHDLQMQAEQLLGTLQQLYPNVALHTALTVGQYLEKFSIGDRHRVFRFFEPKMQANPRSPKKQHETVKTAMRVVYRFVCFNIDLFILVF